MMWFSFALLALLATAQGRAVNISNTWVLPEEGFPVFYRYFRDRISWYEADAVCQFHHANLVTVDTTAQYDAVRAYLKELDISSAVWVGLIRSNPDGDFTWTDYRGLSGDGYWSTSPDSRSAPLCAAADPVADYRWEARACGGPTVASFICELPVPQWALGNEGCMVRALPALTILYLPESAAVQLTADCGLARVKRVQCTGNVKRADLLKDISCAEEDTTITPSILSSSTAELTTDLIFTGQESQSEFAAEDVTSTSEHEDENENPITIIPSFESRHINFSPDYLSLSKIDNNKLKQMFIAKNVNLDSVDRNNQQSNFIPKIASDKNVLTDEEQEKLEDNIHMQHKMLHEEFAKFGNFENIFTQPTDHFVPPLVMAKAKISDDMTVISLAEKHAQHLAEQHFPKQVAHYGHTDDTYLSTINVKSSTKAPIIDYSEKPLVMTMQTNLLKSNSKKDKLKIGLKKYSERYNDLASKFLKSHNIKPIEINKATEYYTTSTEPSRQSLGTSTTEKVSFKIQSVNSDDGPIIDLKVIIKEKPLDNNTQVTYMNVSEDISKSEIINKTVVSNESVNIMNDSILMENKQLLQPVTQKSVTLGHEVITITIPSEDGSTSAPTILEITTLAPIFHDNLNDEHFSLSNSDHVFENLDQLSTNVVTNTENILISHYNTTMTSSGEKSTTLNFTSSTSVTPNTFDQKYNTSMDLPITNKDKMVSTASVLPNVDISNITNMELEIQSTTTYGHEEAAIGEYDINTENNLKNSSEVIDDFQSPLLSGANEPLPRPNRSRRPQQQQIRNKFNPFRILG